MLHAAESGRLEERRRTRNRPETGPWVRKGDSITKPARACQQAPDELGGQRGWGSNVPRAATGRRARCAARPARAHADGAGSRSCSRTEGRRGHRALAGAAARAKSWPARRLVRVRMDPRTTTPPGSPAPPGPARAPARPAGLGSHRRGPPAAAGPRRRTGGGAGSAVAQRTCRCFAGHSPWPSTRGNEQGHAPPSRDSGGPP